MAHLLAQVRFNRVTNVVADQVVNTFHFDASDLQAPGDAYNSIINRLKAFYDTAPPEGGSALRSYMSSILPQNGHEIRIYNMADVEPRSPRISHTWNFTGPLQTTNVVPAEVALCLSFKAAGASGQAAAQRRGRIFWGPLAPSIGNSEGDIRPSSSMMEALANCGKRLLTTPAGDPVWAVYSTVANGLYGIVSCSVDNAFDTQRRRGAKATSKVIRP